MDIDIKQKQKKPSFKLNNESFSRAKENFWKRFWANKSTKKKAIIIIVVIIVLTAATLIYCSVKAKDESCLVAIKKRFASNLPRPFAVVSRCPLTGLEVESDKAVRMPIGVMIENLDDPEVRPQSGISKADLIYEALTEGGITRFEAFYACQDAEEIRPVRSARDWAVDYAEGLNAVYAHCGGNHWALVHLREYGTKDLDEIYNAAQYFWRGPGYAPHNLYTNTDLLRQAMRYYISPEKGDYETWKFKDDAKKENTPDQQTVFIDYGSDSYNVEYKYDKESNSYLRFEGGKPHLDKLTGEQIRVKNVVVMYMHTEPEPFDIEGGLRMHTTGKNKMYVFQDGIVKGGFWEKKSRTERERYYWEKDGSEIKFNRGLTWVSVVPEGQSVRF